MNAAATGLTGGQVNRVFRDIDQKRKTTQYLHLGPELANDVPGDLTFGQVLIGRHHGP